MEDGQDEEPGMYDLIGDIHGHADELRQLLQLLGYRTRRQVYRQAARKVIFLGDFIDRGPQIRQVLEIVRPMVEEGEALAIMGNHELNALAFHTEYPKGSERFLRKRDTKNIRQHGQTLLQLNDQELAAALEWFRTLPMWLDLKGLRAVHACWDENAIRQIQKSRKPGHGEIDDEFLQSACRKDQPLFGPVETVLKGKETRLPPGASFADKDGHERTEMRTRWYLPPLGQTYRTYAFQADTVPCDQPLENEVMNKASPYLVTEKPVFFGHYWLSAKRPEILAKNVACLDYSVARRGFLCAYRWDGEQELESKNFVWVQSLPKNI